MTRKTALWLLSLGLVLAVFATYAGHFDNTFHFDDNHGIEENTYVHSLGNVPKLFSDGNTGSSLPTNTAYRPVLMTVYSVSWALGGGSTVPFHIVGLLFHLGVAALMAMLFKRILDVTRPGPSNAFVAVILAGWFALHTANAETVNYISAQSDSLSTLAVLGALLIHLTAKGWKRHLSYLVLALGMLVKVSTAMYVPILFVYDLLFLESVGLWSMFKKDNRPALVRSLKKVAPAAVVVIAFFALTMLMTPATQDAGGGPIWRYLITQPFVMLRYFWTFFLPIGLSADTDWTTLSSVLDWRFFVGIAFVLAAVAGAVWTSERKQFRPVAFGVLWFFLALLPTSSVFTLAEVTNDHRMYFPFIGLILAAGWALAYLYLSHEDEVNAAKGARAVVVFGIVAVLLAHSLGAFQRSQVWDNEESLWADVTVQSPDNGRGLMNYGITQMSQGRYQVALEYFEDALDTRYGTHPYLYINLALAYEGTGQMDQVEPYYEAALRNGPNYPAVPYYYAVWLVERGRSAEAEQYVEQSLTLSPGFQPAQVLQAEISGYMSQLADIEARATTDPTASNWLNLSLAYNQVGRYRDSIAAAEQALAVDPNSAAAYNNVCAAQNSLGDYQAAIVACTQALEIDPDFALAVNNLAWAQFKLAELGG